MQSILTLFGRGGVFLAGGLLLAGVATVGCGDDDASDEETISDIEATVKQVAESDGTNADYVFAHVTDNFIETVLFAEREECEAAPVECIGEPAMVESISNTEVDGDTAKTLAVLDFGPAEVGLVREDDTWLVDSVGAASDEVAEGTTFVDLLLGDFTFIFDEGDIPVGGDFAFKVTNGGAQVHEVVVVEVPEGSSLEEAVGAVAEEVVPPTAYKVFIQPGQEVDMALEAPLSPGNYVLVCFFPDVTDPEFTSHVEKGMLAEFTVE